MSSPTKPLPHRRPPYMDKVKAKRKRNEEFLRENGLLGIISTLRNQIKKKSKQSNPNKSVKRRTSSRLKMQKTVNLHDDSDNQSDSDYIDDEVSNNEENEKHAEEDVMEAEVDVEKIPDEWEGYPYTTKQTRDIDLTGWRLKEYSYRDGRKTRYFCDNKNNKLKMNEFLLFTEGKYFPKTVTEKRSAAKTTKSGKVHGNKGRKSHWIGKKLTDQHRANISNGVKKYLKKDEEKGK